MFVPGFALRQNNTQLAHLSRHHPSPRLVITKYAVPASNHCIHCILFTGFWRNKRVALSYAVFSISSCCLSMRLATNSRTALHQERCNTLSQADHQDQVQEDRKNVALPDIRRMVQALLLYVSSRDR